MKTNITLAMILLVLLSACASNPPTLRVKREFLLSLRYVFWGHIMLYTVIHILKKSSDWDMYAKQ